MLTLDATELYELSEASARLLVDPVRLRRWARTGRAPSARVGAALGFPVAWVDAACGRSATDEPSLRRWWLERLAPPRPDAARPVRDRGRLPATELRTPEAAARALCCDAARLRRLDAEGRLPALRVDGELGYDGTLVDLAAREAARGVVSPEAEARRAEVAGWARFAWSAPGSPPPPAATTPAPAPAVAAAPRAWHLPDDLAALPSEPPPPEPTGGAAADGSPDGLLEADGFETVDED